MFYFLFKLGLRGSVVCSYVKKQEGDDGIVGGEDIDISEAPYQVAILLSCIHICGGSIVDNDIIVTAAHCVELARPEITTIRVGSSFSQYGGEIYFVSKFIQHPAYTRETLDYDVAIIRLSKSLRFRNAVKPIKMADMGDEIPDEAEVVVTGWGRLKQCGTAAIILQRVVLPKVNQNDCVRAYNQILNVTSRMTCAGFLEGGKSCCKGDSGGPVVYNNKLAGIVSWGMDCARPGFPDVNAKVAALRNWIDETIA